MRRRWLAWLAVSGVATALLLCLALLSDRFAYETVQAARPTLWAAGLLSGAGLCAGLAWRVGLRLPAGVGGILTLAALGAVMRIAMLCAQPIWEDDFYRYLWDGAQVSNGHNPYLYSPQDALGLSERLAPATLRLLALDAPGVVERVNNPDLATIYPPVAQAAYALAHRLKPYDLTVWRLLLLACETVALLLLLRVLRQLGLSPFWAALYWLNPLVAKEMLNSAHVDALLPPLMLAALSASLRGRAIVSGVWLGLAAGVKLWPVLLVPVAIRAAWGAARRPAGRWVIAAAIPAVMLALWVAPLALRGLDDTSGAAAYAQSWVRNALLFPILSQAVSAVGRAAGLASQAEANLIARAMIAAAISAIALGVAKAPLQAPSDLARRMFLAAMGWFVLLPAQYPWYAMAILPLCATARAPWTALALTTLLPAYYAAKGFVARDQHLWANLAPWVQHPAILLAVCWDMRCWRRGPSPC